MLRKKITLQLFVLGIVFLCVTSFVPWDNGKSEPPVSFNTDGLYYAEFYDYIYRGHFEHIKMTTEDLEFLSIFEQYLRAYGRQCGRYLPTNKVEIMEQVCSVERVGRNLYGDEVSRTCVEWEWVGTGLYARPDLYDAKMEVEGILRAQGLQIVVDMVTDPNALGNNVDMMHKANGLKNDMAKIFTMNSCNGAGVRQFENNLREFALKKEPFVRMKEASKYTAMKASGGPTGSQNLAKLVDDLVIDQSKTWGFNRYVPGSVKGVTMYAKDGQGRPKDLKANYVYKGFGGNSQGWVRVTFKNGLPDCIYFFDFPANCKTPNSSIVASYAQGKYSQ